MLRSLLTLIVFLVSLPIANANDALQVEADETILVQQDHELPDLSGESLKTQNVKVEMIADEEFPENLKNFPGLIEKIQTERLVSTNRYALLPHKPNYFMPLTYQKTPHTEEQRKFYGRLAELEEDDVPKVDNVEFVFQLSTKFVLANNLFGKFSDLSVAYTNKSYWQSYNSKISAPFRETNHEPEIMLGFDPGVGWADYVQVALNHQSNGQTGSLSRSWNRITAQFVNIWPNRILSIKPWWRIPESKKENPEDTNGDDNPDIHQYLGYGEVFYLRKFNDHSVGITVRNNFNFDNNKGAVELDWTFPLTKNFQGFVQVFSGYGENLIDYNQYQQRIGVGIKISDLL